MVFSSIIVASPRCRQFCGMIVVWAARNPSINEIVTFDVKSELKAQDE